MQRYNKAIAAAVTAIIMFVFLGEVKSDPELEAAIFTIVETFVVYLVPNKGSAQNG